MIAETCQECGAERPSWLGGHHECPNKPISDNDFWVLRAFGWPVA